MNKNKIKLTLLSVTVLAMLVMGNMALASEATGILTTGEVIVIVSPTASPAGGTYTAVQEVTLSAEGSSSIRYTFDGTMPDCSASGAALTYQTPIPVTVSRTIKAISCYSNNTVSSAIASFEYIINLPPPAAPTGGGGGGGGGGSAYIPPTATSTLSAAAQKVDANKDNKIDVLDFNTLMVNWGKTETGNIADFNSDGKVDIFDFNMLMINWTK